MTFEIRHAQPADAAALALLGERTFREAYQADNRPEDMDEYVALTYSEALQRGELESPDIRTLLACHEGLPVAFCQLRRSEPDQVEIWRFYVDARWHGRGLAQQLMRASLQQAADMGARSVWLGVWERNPRAIAFYRKLGFEHVGQHEFVLGQERQIDLVFELRDLASR